MNFRTNGLQQLGRAMMLPIAVLPIAGLLLRVGQPDLLGWPAMAAAGDAIFSNLGLLFAVGVGVGLARENHGAAGLAALVCYLVTTRGVETLMAVPPAETLGLAGAARELAVTAFKAHELAKLSVPVGLLSGIIAGIAYNRLGNIVLPSYLSFFGGRRFVAIATGLAGLVLAAIFGFAWPAIEHGMDAASHAILGAGSFGLFTYGVLNRVLIVTGLHHILNNFAWFMVGDFHGATGDLKRFFAGDPSAGAFMSGFFPVMMFGLPGACLAMYHAAPRDRRAGVAGMLLSLALTSFLTGVTEPIEFTFMFLAPVLYAVHAVATGLAMVLMNLLGVRLGFSFSAGLFDYLLNFSHAQRPLLLVPVGLAYSALYYFTFRFCIVRLDLATPGRELDDKPGLMPAAAAATAVAAAGGRGASFVTALGGAANLQEVEACTTRLRLVVADSSAINEAALRQLGSRGVVRPSANTVQVVLGPIADQVAGEMRASLRAAPVSRAAPVPPAAPASPEITGPDTTGLLAALGGSANIVDLAGAPGRLLLKLARPEAVDDAALVGLGVRGVARPGGSVLHLLLPGPASDTLAALRTRLARA